MCGAQMRLKRNSRVAPSLDIFCGKDVWGSDEIETSFVIFSTFVTGRGKDVWGSDEIETISNVVTKIVHHMWKRCVGLR